MFVSWILVSLCITNEVVFRTGCSVACDEINATPKKSLNEIYNFEVGGLLNRGCVEKSYLVCSF